MNLGHKVGQVRNLEYSTLASGSQSLPKANRSAKMVEQVRRVSWRGELRLASTKVLSSSVRSFTASEVRNCFTRFFLGFVRLEVTPNCLEHRLEERDVYAATGVVQRERL